MHTLKIVRIPEALSVGTDYGLLVKAGALNEAWRLAMPILSPAGQRILKEYGFGIYSKVEFLEPVEKL